MLGAGSKRSIQHVMYMHKLHAKTDKDGQMRERKITCIHCTDKKPFLLEFFRSELDILTSKRK